MEKRKGVFLKLRIIAIFLLVFFTGSCSFEQSSTLIPKQELSPQQEEEIKQAIKQTDHSKLRRIGKPAVPLILERIFEIANDAKLSRDVAVSSDACNFIIDIGHIKDKRALPALEYLLKNTKYRTFRPSLAYALGMIGDKRAIEALMEVYKQEKGYLAKGDTKGPDYGWGLASDYTYHVLVASATALEKLGKKVDIPPDERARFQKKFYR